MTFCYRSSKQWPSSNFKNDNWKENYISTSYTDSDALEFCPECNELGPLLSGWDLKDCINAYIYKYT